MAVAAGRLASRERVTDRSCLPRRLPPLNALRAFEDGPPVESPEDLLQHRLLHSYSYGPWQDWFARAGVSNADIAHGPIFDDTNLAYSAALAGQGIGLLHTALTGDEIAAGCS